MSYLLNKNMILLFNPMKLNTYHLSGGSFFSMTGMSQVRGENPQEAPSAGELHSDLQVSDREVWERRSNSESVA